MIIHQHIVRALLGAHCSVLDHKEYLVLRLGLKIVHIKPARFAVRI